MFSLFYSAELKIVYSVKQQECVDRVINARNSIIVVDRAVLVIHVMVVLKRK